MMDAFFDRANSPTLWAFVLGIIALISINKIAARLIEVNANLNDIRQQQFEISKKITALSELVDMADSRLMTIENIARSIDTYVLPDEEVRDAISRIRNSAP